MSEKKKKEPKYYIEKTWKMDCWLALHQRLCWLMFAALAVGGTLLIVTLLPRESASYGVIVLAFLLMFGYQWAAASCTRAMNGWILKQNAKTVSSQDCLHFLEQLEKRLPAMKKKEMAYRLTVARGSLLFATGKRQEGIDLLEGFDRCWDESQKEQIAHIIQDMKNKMAQPAEKKDENP